MTARPARLRPGSRVAVVAPAGPIPEQLLAGGVRLLESWGLDVRVGKHVLDTHPTLPYLAGSDAGRAADFQDAWCDPSVDAVLCARGGYGCLRMVDLVDWDAMAAAAPKVFLGSSDVTVLHSAFARYVDVVTLFGPMIASDKFVHDETAREHLRRTLFEPDEVRVLSGPASATMVPGVARGVVVGGNASLLSAQLGAPGVRAPENAILVLEDVTEAPYRLDGILTALLRSEWFTGVTGVALGSWTECGNPAQVEAVLADLVGSLGMPTVWELGFGHCPGQLTVPLGAEAELDAGNGTLTILEPALR
ncbi:S66 peptidase family protein [Actinocrispum wychmicini]|uniref:Muramoyltetrapeptide carboxypeptidase n=1 Tax=Actinocrispum wychmicini TaxID=1213861 RepID=A0A4R2JUI9_9PSEU|nr:muramoyltetrapeptide carboxypeptidase [Actinocrispum wychmicini]